MTQYHLVLFQINKKHARAQKDPQIFENSYMMEIAFQKSEKEGTVP